MTSGIAFDAGGHKSHKLQVASHKIAPQGIRYKVGETILTFPSPFASGMAAVFPQLAAAAVAETFCAHIRRYDGRSCHPDNFARGDCQSPPRFAEREKYKMPFRSIVQYRIEWVFWSRWKMG